MEDIYCDECGDYHDGDHSWCEDCDGDLCTECGGCDCPDTPCPGYVAHVTGTH
ncbi:hypothetical protein ACIBEA_36580 [Streptomyces sp. NPDC051555]|uniref:hypothetical protein n=1 Tax=Streptomyces sp. NPDC051555 TaxID=3365657 RepID=UPI0037BBABFE